MSPSTPSIGVAIQAFNAREMVQQIRQAEAAGIPTAWTTIGGAGGADPLTVFAAALMETTSIRLGTAIIPTWPRHAIVIGQQAMALDQLGPGRLRLGIGPSHEPGMTRTFGVEWDTPLTHLREYLQTLRSLFTTGEVEFEGRHVTARTKWREPVPVELLASALRPRSFEVCGELTDGAISWMCPRTYLLEEALPALRRGAERAGRETPPLIAHVPIAITTARDDARSLARRQVGGYASVPFYRAMFEAAGHTIGAEGYSDGLLDDLVVSGTEEEVAERIAGYIADGCGEVLVHPLIDTSDRDQSIARSFRAVARAHALVVG
ncbi:MAG: LLM class flavin-dependent oxidoreductase [Chloroflexi bacterium]|nr:LLM class flavin-dependent oxidoreductase [Chloroflexota bacterium]MDA1239818.1 LLM class flavin-dependent oxidoreductase [Chloroflexota bacterium]